MQLGNPFVERVRRERFADRHQRLADLRADTPQVVDEVLEPLRLAGEFEILRHVLLDDACDVDLGRRRRRWCRFATPDREPDGGDGNEE